MKISRVLNNSCVVVQDDNKKEMVLFGNGIGFSKRAGDSVNKDKIDKVFVMKRKNSVDRFAELINQIPEGIVELSEDLIEFAREKIMGELDDSIHISLPDHIAGAIENYKEGVVLHNTLLLEIRKFYQREYEIGEKGVKMIAERIGIKMQDDEAGFIAMHFVNAQTGAESDQTRAIIRLVDEIDKIILNRFGQRMKTIDKNSLIYCRYMTHLKFFAQRVLTKTYFEENDVELFDYSIQKHREEYECSCEICKYIEQKYGYEVRKEEIVYLTVHLVLIMRRKNG